MSSLLQQLARSVKSSNVDNSPCCGGCSSSGPTATYQRRRAPSMNRNVGATRMVSDFSRSLMVHRSREQCRESRSERRLSLTRSCDLLSSTIDDVGPVVQVTVKP